MSRATTVRTAGALLSRAIVVAIALSFLPSAAHAQVVSSATDGKTPSGLAPGAPAGSFPLSGFENVNPYNGNLNFRLPLLGVGGRGDARTAVTLAIDAKKWRVEHHVTTHPDTGVDLDSYAPKPNWWTGIEPGYGPGVLQGRQVGEGARSCSSDPFYRWYFYSTLTRLTFTAGDGTEYELRDQLTGGQPATVSNPCAQGASRGAVFVTADGTSATFLSDAVIYDTNKGAMGRPTYIYPSGFLMLRDGTRYRIDSGRVTWLRDRNGNRVSFAYTQGRVTTITDSLNRQVTVAYDLTDTAPYTFYDEITYTGFGGAARTIRVRKGTLGNSFRPNSGYSLQTYKGLFPELNNASTATQFNPTVTKAVVLPDGRSYKFYYNPYGELARVELPTGGAVEYDPVAGSGAISNGYDYQIYRRVGERRTYPDGGTGAAFEGRMTYSSTYISGVGDAVTVDQLDRNGALLARSKHYYYGSAGGSLFDDMPTGYTPWKDGREYKTEEIDTAGCTVSTCATVLRRTEQTWQQPVAGATWPLPNPETDVSAKSNNPQVTQVLTTLADTNQVAKQTFAYDKYGNNTDAYEYDYGAGAPGAFVRRTHVEYVTTNTVGGVPYDYACDPATTCSNQNITANVIHLRALPRRQWVSADAGGSNKVSITTQAYDQSGLTDRAGITGMCTTYTGAQCSSANSAAYVTRGNLSGVTRYADAAGEAGTITASSIYDIAGNIVSTTNPKGYMSQISYSDSFCNGSACGGTFTANTYAFVTGTTSPVPDVSTEHQFPAGTFGSTVAFTSSNVYDFYTGFVYSATDANSKTTTFEYGDGLNRPTAEVRPDGSRTDFQYNDAVGNLYVRVLSDLSAARRIEVRRYFDGLGRPYRALTYENQVPATPWLATDTQYDALGRVARASPSYRTAGGAAPLTPTQWSDARRAETEYDALGRVKKVTTLPDTAAVTTSYSGNTMTVTDQAGKSRRSVSDAVGRLREVYEDPDGVNYLTSYDYDVLGNLRAVTQGTQAARTFVYDSLGRLTSASHPESGVTGYTYDANGNPLTRTDARGVTASYTYDRLDRQIITTYAGGGTSTPEIRRHYDGATNGFGRLHWSEAVGISATVFDIYDAVGRPTQYHQSFWTGSGWGQGFGVQRTYNKAGAVISQSYPSGHTVTYNHDAAGRLGDYNGQPAFQGTLGDGVSRTYASEISYHELGGPKLEKYGTDTPLYNRKFYNSRGQLAEIRVGTAHATDDGWWNRGAIINHYSNAPGAWGSHGGGPDDNGNLLKQEIFVPHDEQITQYTNVVQEYNYDSLNRLTSVYDKPFNGAADFYQLYQYDRWGNRRIDQNSSNTPKPNFTVNQTTNQLAPPAGFTMTYDAVGNLTNDNYTGAGARAYDAESRITSAQDFYGQTSAYAYDADGRRVRRAVGGGAAVWQVYGIDGELLAEYAADTSPSLPLKEYGYRGGELLVQASAPVSAGTGLTAQYFDNSDLTNPKLTRTDASVNFDWASGSPHAAVGADTFSVRWEGKVEPLYSQTYTFYTVTDDGVRLWVNGQLIIDRWVDQGPTEWSGQIALQAGQRYDIRMEFYENAGGATTKLLWSSASQAKGVIAQSRLYPAGAANAQVDLRWLVADQLGTPRMVLDKGGSLAGVRRHDYLPFGEEIAADPTWRTTGRGYVADSVRQRFTGYERDGETGLDYAQARHYASEQGRFTAVDPLLASARVSQPQTWNRYAYAVNNPLRYTDPSGMTPAQNANGFEGNGQPSDEQKPAPQIDLPPIAPPMPPAISLPMAPQGDGPVVTDPGPAPPALLIYLNAAMNLAEQALRLPGCQALFQPAGINGAQVFREMRAAGDFRVADESLMIPGPDGQPMRFIDSDLAGINLDGLSYINPNDPLINGTPTPADALMGGANQVQVIAGVLIHEELHEVGVFPPDHYQFNIPGIGQRTHNQESLIHSLKVMSACIHPLRTRR